MSPRAAFILGCQRSGTTVLYEVLSRSARCRAFGEHDSAAMCDYRLRAQSVVEALIAPQGLTLFKPICDSHYGDEILRRYPESKLLWIFRDIGTS